MDIDTAKIDEDILALLHLTSFRDRPDDLVARAWKGHDWEALDRLHAAGFIDNPRSKNKSVLLTAEGCRRAEELFRRKYSKEV